MKKLLLNLLGLIGYLVFIVAPGLSVFVIISKYPITALWVIIAILLFCYSFLAHCILFEHFKELEDKREKDSTT